jgi:acetyl-CoA carboxylase biotin carboxyl carrier protein
MDFKQIQELIKMINKSNIGELSIEQKDFRITIRQKEDNITQVVSSGNTSGMPQMMHQPMMQQSAPALAAAAETPGTSGPAAYLTLLPSKVQ